MLAAVWLGCGNGANGEVGGPPALLGKPEVTVPEGSPPAGLEVEDIERGSGAPAERGDRLTLEYVGAGYESGDEFGSSWDSPGLVSFRLGSGEAIPGWERGLEGMRPGGRRELIVPARLAGGPAEAPAAAPSGEALVFVVDLFELGQ